MRSRCDKLAYTILDIGQQAPLTRWDVDFAFGSRSGDVFDLPAEKVRVEAGVSRLRFVPACRLTLVDERSRGREHVNVGLQLRPRSKGNTSPKRRPILVQRPPR